MQLPTKDTFQDRTILHDRHRLSHRQIDQLLLEESGRQFLAEKMNYPNNIKPGRYRLINYMSNKQLIDLLRSGKQEPV